MNAQSSKRIDQLVRAFAKLVGQNKDANEPAVSRDRYGDGSRALKAGFSRFVRNEILLDETPSSDDHAPSFNEPSHSLTRRFFHIPRCRKRQPPLPCLGNKG